MKRLPSHFFIKIAFLFPVLLVSCSGAYYTSWEHNKQVKNIPFEKLRYGVENGDTTSIIGYLSETTEIQGFQCAADWVQFTNDWELTLLKLAKKKQIGETTFPPGTWIKPRENMFIAVFPLDTVIQGFPCRGNGTSKGIQTSFYPSGRLRSFFPPDDIVIGQINCKASLLNNIVLFENGTLKSCTLAEDQLIQQENFKEGSRVSFHQDGRVMEPK